MSKNKKVVCWNQKLKSLFHGFAEIASASGQNWKTDLLNTCCSHQWEAEQQSKRRQQASLPRCLIAQRRWTWEQRQPLITVNGRNRGSLLPKGVSANQATALCVCVCVCVCVSLSLSLQTCPGLAGWRIVVPHCKIAVPNSNIVILHCNIAAS